VNGRRWASVAVTALLLAACGGDDDGGAVAPGDEDATTTAPDAGGAEVTLEDCVAATVAAMASLDVSGLPTEGTFDDAQRADFEARVLAAIEPYPEIAEGGPCDPVMSEMTEQQAGELLAQIPGDVAAVLGVSSRERLDEVSDTIGPN
jgi:hypothetical protein